MTNEKKRENEVAEAIRAAAASLGLSNAATPMGAIEAHAQAITEAAETIAAAILELAEAVRESKR